MSQNIALKIKTNYFEIDGDSESFDLGSKIVCETPNGLQLGDAVAVCPKKVTGGSAKFIRVASDEDIKKAEKIAERKNEVIKVTNSLIKKNDLKMKIVDIDFTLDETKVIISFVCEDRVDFRELVKDLASNLKLRIELKQIGIRDQARLVGSIGICGKEVCCRQFLDDFDKVSIKMAKTQGLSLNPTKISGVCGRLMCCLAYENDLYAEISEKMPKLNSTVKTPDGEGTVCYNNLLKQTVTVKITCDNEIKITEYPLDKIEFTKKKKEENE